MNIRIISITRTVSLQFQLPYLVTQNSNEGETATIEVILANRGVIYGFKADKSVGTSETLHELSLDELQYETMRTTAYGIKASLVSPTDMIDVDSETNSHTLEELYPGVLPDNPMEFTITLSEDIPAGVYILDLPLNYEYQSDVRMTAGESIILGEPDLDHTSIYTNVETTLQIPIIVKPEAKFEITNVTGNSCIRWYRCCKCYIHQYR